MPACNSSSWQVGFSVMCYCFNCWLKSKQKRLVYLPLGYPQVVSFCILMFYFALQFFLYCVNQFLICIWKLYRSYNALPFLQPIKINIQIFIPYTAVLVVNFRIFTSSKNIPIMAAYLLCITTGTYCTCVKCFY